MNFKAFQVPRNIRARKEEFADQLQDDVYQVQFTARSRHAPSRRKESEE